MNSRPVRVVSPGCQDFTARLAHSDHPDSSLLAEKSNLFRGSVVRYHGGKVFTQGGNDETIRDPGGIVGRVPGDWFVEYGHRLLPDVLLRLPIQLRLLRLLVPISELQFVPHPLLPTSVLLRLQL